MHRPNYLFSLCNCDGFQERQSIIKYWLDNLRARQGEVLHNIHFLEGQPISTLSFIMTELFHCYSPFCVSLASGLCGFYAQQQQQFGIFLALYTFICSDKVLSNLGHISSEIIMCPL